MSFGTGFVFRRLRRSSSMRKLCISRMKSIRRMRNVTLSSDGHSVPRRCSSFMLCAVSGYESSVREWQLLEKGRTMKPNWEDDYEMPAEYDLTNVKIIRNAYAQRFQELNLVSLDTDVKAVFP